MFTLLSGAYEQWIRRPEYNVLILGLDGAGKTTLLERLKGVTSEKIDVVPTVGMNLARIKTHECMIKFWDLGGAEQLHKIWQSYYPESDAIIFVIDGKDQERMERARHCFGQVTGHEELEGVPVLLLINKQDLLPDEDLTVKLKEFFNPMIANISAREARIACCSARNGYSKSTITSVGSFYLIIGHYRSGIKETISWLVEKIKRK